MLQTQSALALSVFVQVKLRIKLAARTVVLRRNEQSCLPAQTNAILHDDRDSCATYKKRYQLYIARRQCQAKLSLEDQNDLQAYSMQIRCTIPLIYTKWWM